MNALKSVARTQRVKKRVWDEMDEVRYCDLRPHDVAQNV